jgi:hypothetical protein
MTDRQAKAISLALVRDWQEHTAWVATWSAEGYVHERWFKEESKARRTATAHAKARVERTRFDADLFSGVPGLPQIGLLAVLRYRE